MDLPRLEKDILIFGSFSLSINDCDLDDLIYFFGIPENYYYLSSDSRFVVFEFQHELGSLFAILFFRNYDYPISFEFSKYFPGLDRGELAELQIELDQPITFKQIGKIKRRLYNESFKFVVFAKNVIARGVARGQMNGISFLNSKMITKPEKSFMFNLGFWFNSTESLFLERYFDKKEFKELAAKN